MRDHAVWLGVATLGDPGLQDGSGVSLLTTVAYEALLGFVGHLWPVLRGVFPCPATGVRESLPVALARERAEL